MSFYQYAAMGAGFTLGVMDVHGNTVLIGLGLAFIADLVIALVRKIKSKFPKKMKVRKL